MPNHRVVALALGMGGIAATAYGAVMRWNTAQRIQMTMDHAAALQCMRAAHERAIDTVIHDLGNMVGRAQNVLDRTLIQAQEEGYSPAHAQMAWDDMDAINSLYHRTVANLRDAVRLHHGTLQLQPALTNIEPLIEHVQRALYAQYRAAPYPVGVTIASSRGAVWAWCDAARVQRVLFILLDYAVLHSRGMADGAQITVQLTVQPDQVQIALCDNGEPLTADEVQQRTHVPAPLMDVGVPFCTQILQMSGGTLTMTTSAQAYGTTVIVSVPRRAP